MMTNYRVELTCDVEYDGTPRDAASVVIYSITHNRDPLLLLVTDMDTGLSVTVHTDEIRDY